jgi:hypothetical protein
VRKADKGVKLTEVKLALSCKCERLAQAAHSATKRRHLLNHAARFRRQAVDLSRS